jgi:amidase
MLKSIQSTQPWLRDPAVAQIPYRQDMFDSYLARASADGAAAGQPLKFGIVVHDGIQALHPPVRRGLEMTRQALEAAGHKV